ncbi:MAG TPA: alpha/beta hydrolase [Chitinophagaceae bacterium]|nr:alpha/beta hydrolase [Chitinophagaceae bacterium]HAN38379.1 alpha/beta hydrolase [Chitinophagaceae bacterium]
MQQFQYQHTTQYFETHGQGAPVVLLHGFGFDATIWKHQIAALATSYQCIVPYLPGIKEGSSLTGKIEASLTDYNDVVVALLDHLHVSAAVIIGHSMGGYIAAAMAASHPKRVKAIGFVHSTTYADSAEKKENRRKAIAVMEQYGGASFLQSIMPNFFGAAFKNEHPEVVAACIDNSNIFPTITLQAYYYAMMMRPDNSSVLQLKKPVLWIAGTEDGAVPLNDILQQAAMAELTYIHVLPAVGHMGMLEAPQQVNQYLLAFLKGVHA